VTRDTDTPGGRATVAVARPLLLVVLVSSAGCVGLFGTDGETTPVTPVPVAEQPAPGVPAAGSGEVTGVRVRTDRLLAANDRARAEQSHTVVRTAVVRSAGESLRLGHRLAVGPEGATVERLSVNGTGRLTPAIESGTLWTNGSRRYSRVRLPDGRTVTTELLSLEGSPFVTDRPLAPAVLRNASFAVTQRADGAVLDSRGPASVDRPVLPVPMGEPRNVTVRAVVRSDGLVSRLDVSYDVPLDGAPASVDITRRVVDRGTTVVSRPEWVPPAGDRRGPAAGRVAGSVPVTPGLM
jgi:hypothetical protein